MAGNSERAGYTVSLFALDVSPFMAEIVEDAETGQSKSKLDWAKEYIARKMDYKIMSGRKTEHVGLLTFGADRTNNEANQNWLEANPGEEDDQPYTNIECNVAIQTAKPSMMEELLNAENGTAEGNPVSALVVALDMIRVHRSTKSWFQEIYLITDGESAFEQYEYEEVIDRLVDLGIKLFIIGVGFEEPDQTVDKTKPKNKRLSEKFWRAFSSSLSERFGPDNPAYLPSLGTLSNALHVARLPHPHSVSSTLSSTTLTIGTMQIDEHQVISINVRFSKATSKAKAKSTKKAWKPALEQQPAPRLKPEYYQNMQSTFAAGASQASQSQSLRKPTDSQMYEASKAGYASFANGSQGLASAFSTGQVPPAKEAADPKDRFSAEVKGYTKYVIRRDNAPASTDETQATQGTQTGSSKMTIKDGILSSKAGLEDEAEEEEEDEAFKSRTDEVQTVEKEDLVKAYRFGSSWVPMEEGIFEPMATNKGIEVLNFFPSAGVKRHLLIGEVQFIWPDLAIPRAQIQFSSFVQAMQQKEYCALVRWVNKDNSAPRLGVCFPEIDNSDPERPLEFMFWVQLPFAEDEHNFYFPSLENIKTTSGKVLTEHPLLPTEDQCDMMVDLVNSMDLDHVQGEDGSKPGPWFDVCKSYNPVIHRINEAIFHNAIAIDLEADPTPPPHPILIKYFDTPEEIMEKVETPVSKLKESLDIKVVPPKPVRKVDKTGIRPDEGYIDIDALLGNGEVDSNTKLKSSQSQPSTPVKRNPKSQYHGDAAIAPKEILSDEEEEKPEIASQDVAMEEPEINAGKPKDGRVISNETPLEDFDKITSAEGDVLLKKAIQDMGEVVKENIAGSFSTSAFPLALDCLERMKDIAKRYEEVETYNDFVERFEPYIKAKGFKHKDFWKHFEEAGTKVSAITAEEARLALEDDMDDEDDD